MTSPTPTSLAPSPHFISQPFNLSQPPPHRRNLSGLASATAQSTSSRASSPVVSSHNPPSALSTEGHDAIREGKQRAKDIMAASGFDARSSPAQNASPVASYPNGAPMSRKRSRSGSRIPARKTSASMPADADQPPHDQVLLNRYMQRDSLHAAAMIDQAERSRALLRLKEQEKDFYMTEGRQIRQQHPGVVFGHGYNGYGNGRTDQKTRLDYPAHRRRAGNRRTPELQLLRKDAAQQAEYLEELVPLRLDIELDKLRLRDTFTWNLHDRTVPMALFAQGLVEDLRLPIEVSPQLIRQVHQDLVEQLTHFYPHVWPTAGPAEPLLPYDAHKNDDMRIMIKLNITIGHITLVDQFEWDINNPSNSPEEFSKQMGLDLSLSGEFTTAIAHSIREQAQLYSKSLFLTNYEFDGRPVEDADIKDNLLPTPMFSSFRAHQAQKDWTPYLYELNETELEKTELSMLREQRAQKRQLNRRGGPTLPDLKDRPRTVRSLVVSSVIPGAAETLEASGIFKIRRTATGRGRRVRADDASDTDDLEMEDSGPESPVPSQINIGTTARTRNMRGAASAAQAAMRGSYGRSQTPDMVQLESRTSARRSGAHEMREDTEEPMSLVVKLRISPAKYRQWMARRKFGPSGAPPLSGFPTSVQALPLPVSARPPQAAAAPTTMRPPTTPAMHNKVLPAATSAPQQQADAISPSRDSAQSTRQRYDYNHEGRIDALVTPEPKEAIPPPPSWLTTELTTLHTTYPTHSFTALMVFKAIDAATNEPVPFDTASLAPGTGPPAPPAKNANGDTVGSGSLKWQWLPRIRCGDCPNKLYRALPGTAAENFEQHLKNRVHNERVDKRIRREAGE